MAELTPQILSTSILLVILASSMLTLIASAAILLVYRHSVVRGMTATAANSDATSSIASSSGGAPLARSSGTEAISGSVQRLTINDGTQLYHHLVKASWVADVQLVIAGLAFALIMALTAGLAFPGVLTVPLFLLWAWGYSWPLVLALSSLSPSGIRPALTCLATYFVPLVAGFLIAAWVLPSPSSAPDPAEFRNAITPPVVLRAWAVGNAVPTLLLFLFLHRRIRAAGPLVLGFVTTLLTGFWVTYLVLWTKTGTHLVASIAVASKLAPIWLILGAGVLAIAVFGMVGWGLLKWIRNAYMRKALNDRSLGLDSLWLLFASFFAIWLALAGIGWALMGLLAFVAYKLTWAGAQIVIKKPARPAGTPGLTFLRVFSLGWRSDALLNSVARHWRHVASIQLINGPDLAHSTVQPHQLLDFLSGRLATHFIGDATSFSEKMYTWDTGPDRDGWYRVNTFFCRADTWQAVLARLVLAGDVIMMDLRSFSSSNAGCVHELRHLIDFVPLNRCIFLVDETTDLAFTRQTLDHAWKDLRADSPNRSKTPDAVNLHQFTSGRRALQALLRRLCDAASAVGDAAPLLAKKLTYGQAL